MTSHQARAARAARAALLLSLTSGLFASTAQAQQEQDVVFTAECTTPEARWLVPWMQQVDATPLLRTRFGDNRPYSSVSDVARADQRLKEGQSGYLTGNHRASTAPFEEAFRIYTEALAESPFCTDCYRGVTRAGFYWATSLLLAGDKNGAREALEGFFQRYPNAEPEPGLFPVKLTRILKDVQRDMKAGSARLTVQLNPPDAALALNGRIIADAASPTTLADLNPGSYRLGVGMPGVGTRLTDVSIADAAASAEVNLLQPPESLRAECGRPASDDLLQSAAALEGSPRFLILLTDARSIGHEGSVAWMHDARTLALTAVVLLPLRPDTRDAEALAAATPDLLSSSAREVRALRTGRLQEDSELEAAVDSLLNLNHTNLVEPEPPGGPRGAIRLGLAVGTGLGYVSDGQTQEPGFASSLFLLRPDVAYALSDSLDVGLIVRAQLPELLFLAHPYARYRLGPVNLRGGLHLGQVGQTIRQAAAPLPGEPTPEGYNRDVTQGLFGPSLGAEVQLGPLVLGLDAHTPLVPDATLQLDLVIGGSLDL